MEGRFHLLDFHEKATVAARYRHMDCLCQGLFRGDAVEKTTNQAFTYECRVPTRCCGVGESIRQVGGTDGIYLPGPQLLRSRGRASSKQDSAVF